MEGEWAMAEDRERELPPAPPRHPLHWCLLRVRGKDQQVVGAAFLAGKGWACTCAHVVAEALDADEASSERPRGEVQLDFYRDGTLLIGEVECWIPSRGGVADAESQDIALLRVRRANKQALPGRPARLLGPRRLSEHSFATFGFPAGEPAGGLARGVFREQRADGTFQIEATESSGLRVQPGFSGAPVWDERERGVVGMVVSSWRDAQARTAFVIPVPSLLEATGDKLRLVGSRGPFDALTAGLSNPNRLIAFLRNYLGTPERPVPFAGRQAELEALDRWLEDPEPGYRLLVASGGAGKSALLAHWAMELAETDRAEVIFAPISLRFGTNQRVELEQMVLDRVRYLLPDGARIDESALQSVLSQERDADERPLLFVFDAIDEASGWRPELDLPIPPSPVRGVRALVSARVLAGRDAEGWRSLLGWDDIADLMGVGPLGKEDIGEVLTSLDVETSDAAGLEAIIDALYAASDCGDPLLVGLYAAAMGPGGFVTPDHLPDLTRGLSAYFELWWQAQRQYWISEGRDPSEEAERATSLFGTLARARGPLAVDELSALVEIASAAGLTERVHELGRWVIATGGDSRQRAYAFAHPRLGEYWRDQKMTAQEIAHADSKLLRFCKAQLRLLTDGGNPVSASTYAVHYYATHLENVDSDFERFDELVCREWWQAHRWVTGSDSSFLADVARAWERAEGLLVTGAAVPDQGLLLSHLVRYTLIMTRIRSLSRNIPVSLLAQLVAADSHRWTTDWALAHARRHDDHASTLAELAAYVPDGEQAEVVDEALSAVDAVSSKFGVAHTIEVLVPRLSDHQVDRAWAVAQAIAPDVDVGDLIVALAPRLSEQSVGEALSVARLTIFERSRPPALAALAPRLPEGQRPQLLDEALSAARAIASVQDRAEVLANLAPHLSAAQRTRALTEALSLAPAIENEYARARTLADLAPELSEQDVLEALATARAISDDYPRATGLAGLASWLPPLQRAEALSEALSAANEVTDELDRSRALAALIPQLPREDVSDALDAGLRAARTITHNQTRAQALANLAAQLPGDRGARLLLEGLDAARAITDVSWRAIVTAELASQLVGDQRTRALEEALSASQTVDDAHWRAMALVDLALHLSDDQRTQALDEALNAARAIIDEHARVDALLALIPHLPEDQRTWILDEALSAARAINGELARAEGLANVAPQLPYDRRIPVLGEALSAALEITDEESRAAAVLGLAPELSEAQADEAFSGALISDVSLGARVIVGLAPWLSVQKVGRALIAARAIAEDGSRAEALAALAPRLPEGRRNEVLAEALSAAQGISDGHWRAQVLGGLAAQLPDEQRGQALGEALTAARGLSDEYWRATALVELVPQLPADQRTHAVGEALSAARTLTDPRSRETMLVEIAEHLPQDHRDEVLGEAVNAARLIAYDEWRAYSLNTVARRLPENQRAHVMDEAIRAVTAISNGVAPDFLRGPALAALLPELSEEQVDAALRIAEAIHREAYRVDALAASAKRLCHFTPVPRHRLAARLLRLIATGSRASLEKSWSGLIELMEVEGTAACSATARSVIEVANWQTANPVT